jgi:CDP-glucose 4,6-dehydratase
LSDVWAGRRVLITGGGGLLGRALARLLSARQARLTCFALRAPRNRLPQEHVVVGDVADVAALSALAAESDVVFHLAGLSQPGVARREPRKNFEANIQGTWSVLEAVRVQQRRVPVVVASSVAAAAEDPSPYAVAKACAELIVGCYQRTYGVPACAVRFSNLYGPNDAHADRLVPSAIVSVLQGDAPVLHSDGQSLLDLLYVEDAAVALTALCAKLMEGALAGGAFEATSGHPVKAIDVVTQVVRLMERADMVPVVLGGESTAAPLPSAGHALRHATGWEPAVDLEAGLRRTIEWYRHHPSEWNTICAR